VIESVAKPINTNLAADDRALLVRAHQVLEHPSLAARLASVVGTPIEVAVRLLPKDWYKRLHAGLEATLVRLLSGAIRSLSSSPTPTMPHFGFHKAIGCASGAMGGLFGLPGMLIEMPVSTTLILRSIADIARYEGEDLNDPATRLECVQVFAFGAQSEEDDAADTGYYGVRLALALSVTNAMRHVIQHGVSADGPAMIGLAAAISNRFGIAMTQKAAAVMVPLIGAAGGAIINAVFMQHFQETAWGHFTIRRLERTYGSALVRQAYELISQEERSKSRWR
jgi:hypothetical protein